MSTANGGRRVGDRARGRVRALLALALIAWFAWVGAQPYAADGGFDRPRAIDRALPRPVAALALDRGEAVLVHVDGAELVARPLAGGPARRLDDGDGVRGATATGGVERDLVALWYRRDVATGRYVYAWTEGDALGAWVQPHDVALVATATGAMAYTVRGRGDLSVLTRLEPGMDDDEAALYTTDRRLGGLSAVADAAGRVHFTWLEGRTDTTAFGARAAWTARAAILTVDGRLADPVDLGATAGPTPATVTALVGDRVDRLWADAEGLVHRSSHEVGAPLYTPAATHALRPGRPLAATADATFLVEGARVWRVDAVDEEAVAVAWSPLVITQAWAVEDAEGVVHVAWTGTATGGDHALFVADDRRPMVRTWRDRVAAAFGWSPWNLVEEALGQVVASALVAVLAAMAAAPLLWLAAVALAGRTTAIVARWRGAVAGASLAPLLLAAAVAAGLSPDVASELVGGVVGLSLATTAAVAVGGFGWACRDLEPSPAFVAAGATSVAVATAVIAFVAFQRWLALTLI